MKLFSLLILITIIFTMTGCESQEDAVKKISNDDLNVKHWHYLSKDRKSKVIREIYDELNNNMTPKGYEDSINLYIKILDDLFKNSDNKKRDLKKAIIEELHLSTE